MTRSTQSHSETEMRPAGFTIKWGRTAVFGASTLAFLAMVITTITALFGRHTGLFALMCLLVTVTGVVTLRVLAIRDQNQKNAERLEREKPETDKAETPRRHEETELFDNPSAQTQPATGHEELIPAELAEQEPFVELKKARRIQRVPAPTYLQLGEAKRPEQKVLEPEKTPKPSGDIKLKDGVSEEFKTELKAKAHTRLDLDKVLRNRRQAM